MATLVLERCGPRHMDFMLEEDLMDLMVFCLQNPDDATIPEKKKRITEIGAELHADGGIGALENFFFALDNRIQGEIGMDAKVFRPLWNGLDPEWNYT